MNITRKRRALVLFLNHFFLNLPLCVYLKLSLINIESYELNRIKQVLKNM